jgi:3-methylfumaryl-CoA hydratase
MKETAVSGMIDDAARAWIGRSQPPVTVEVTRRDIQKYAVATEQRRQKYIDGDEAPPMFLFGLLRPVVPMDQLGPDGIARDEFLPEFPLKRIMAGGTKMTFHHSINAGDTLTATRSLADIQEKQGSTGPLIFVSYNLKVENEAGELVVEELTTRIVR